MINWKSYFMKDGVRYVSPIYVQYRKQPKTIRGMFTFTDFVEIMQALGYEESNSVTWENEEFVVTTKNKKYSKSNRKERHGVYPRGNQWVASITVEGENIHLGYHATENLARKARLIAEHKYFSK